AGSGITVSAGVSGFGSQEFVDEVFRVRNLFRDFEVSFFEQESEVGDEVADGDSPLVAFLRRCFGCGDGDGNDGCVAVHSLEVVEYGFADTSGVEDESGIGHVGMAGDVAKLLRDGVVRHAERKTLEVTNCRAAYFLTRVVDGAAFASLIDGAFENVDGGVVD